MLNLRVKHPVQIYTPHKTNVFLQENISLIFLEFMLLTIPDDLDVEIIRVDRGPYSRILKNSPTPLTIRVPEWIRPDTTISTLVAIDQADHGARVKYQLESGKF